MSCWNVVAPGRYPYTGRLGILDKQDWKLVDEAITMVHAEEVAMQSFTRISDGHRDSVLCWREPSARIQQSWYWMNLPLIWISAISLIF